MAAGGAWLLALLCLVLAGDAFRQVPNEFRSTEPGSLLFGSLQLLMGLSAVLSAIGLVRRARWAAWGSWSWGIAAAALLIAQPLFDPMPGEAVRSIWLGAVAVGLVGAALGWGARRLAVARCVLGFVTVVASACAGKGSATFRHDLPTAELPWTQTRFAAGAPPLRFAIVGDLNGGERPGVFDVAVAQLGALRPELVLSVGDLIDGPTTDDATLTREWDAFDARARAIPAPFFRVGGNHDLTGEELRAVWRRRYGPTYYSFVYRDALFLVLDTEDLSPQRAREVFTARQEAIRVAGTGQTSTDGLEYYRMPERMFGNVGPEQAAYVQRALAAHPNVRWTFLFFHKPVWRAANDPEFAAIEAALANRPYTVFAGHVHSFSRTLRKGREYFTLGTTGGSQGANDPMSFDHLTTVTLTAEGPSIALLKLDGVLGADGKLPRGGDSLCFRASTCAGRPRP